ncbi:MAG: hypothetical protein KAR38_11930 [Calditrichia bacterium]|nr:hypothetical protein [Calditrichia bacterium]
MESKFLFKIIFILSLILILSCKDIPRDNILDPNNTNSYRPQKIFIEAFVNTANIYQYNEYMLSALNEIAEHYGDKVIIAEYHRNTTSYDDQYHLLTNEELYQDYLDAVNSDLEGVPDVFINGINHRVQGASSISSAVERVEQAVLEEIHKNSYFTIEFSYERENNTITPIVKLARLGKDNAENIIIRGILISKYDNQYHCRVVSKEKQNNIIPTLSNGDVKTYTLDSIELETEAESSSFIVCITNSTKTRIYQSEVFLIN